MAGELETVAPGDLETVAAGERETVGAAELETVAVAGELETVAPAEELETVAPAGGETVAMEEEPLLRFTMKPWADSGVEQFFIDVSPFTNSIARALLFTIP